MGDLAGIPLPAWLAAVVWLLGSLAIQYFGHRNKQAETKQTMRDPSWSDYADENRKLRTELDGTRTELGAAREQVDKIRDEFEAFRNEMNDRWDTVREKQDATRRVLAVIAYQAPLVNGTRWRPTLEQRDLDILDDTLPAGWQ
jgi:hypothetical protein